MGAVQHMIPHLGDLVRHRIVQGVGPDVAPEAIEAVTRMRPPGSDDLEDPAGDVKCGLRCQRFGAHRQNHQFSSILRRQLIALVPHRLKNSRGLARGGIGALQCDAELAVGADNVWILNGLGHARRRPRPGLCARVLSGCVESPSRDAEIDVDEDELDERSGLDPVCWTR